MMRAFRFITVLLLLCGTLPAVAQVPPPAKAAPAPEVTLVSGQPITFDFKDGRVAVVKKSVVEMPDQIELPFQVFDSLCSDSRGQFCKYRTSFRNVFYFLAWSKHPDATKINQPVKTKVPQGQTSSDRDILENSELLFGAESALLPLLTSGMQMPSIDCNDFSWLPGGKAEAPAKLFGKRWDAESMNKNPETGVSENRVSMTNINVEWTQETPQRLRLKSVGGFATDNPVFFALLVIGDVTTATIDDQKGGLCAVELKPGSLAGAAQIIDALRKNRPPRDQVTDTYVAGSDESSVEALKGLNRAAPGLSSLISQMKASTGDAFE